MLIADLKNKLLLRELISEDFLTSSVFSTFKYIGGNWLERYLNLAVNINMKNPNISITSPTYEFWPWYSPVAPLKRGTEPDLVVFSGKTAIIIEAKNYSGKSGTGITTQSSNGIDEVEDKDIIDQLGREYIVGLKTLIGKAYTRQNTIFTIDNFILIYITRHKLFPTDDINETISSIVEILPSEEERSKDTIYWLSWHKIVPLLKEIIDTKDPNSFIHMISSDLVEYLEKRDIGEFTGFSYLEKLRNILNAQIDGNIFYNRIFPSYWPFLENYTLLNLPNVIFYSKTCHPYWTYLGTAPNLRHDKNIFYKGGEHG